MNERLARLRTHHQNIDRYQRLLKTNLSETEIQFLQKRLSEERFAVAMLQFMSPGGISKAHGLPDVLCNENAPTPTAAKPVPA